MIHQCEYKTINEYINAGREIQYIKWLMHQERIKNNLGIDIPVFNLGRRSLGTASFFRLLYGLIEGEGIKPNVVILLLPEFERQELIYNNWDIFFRVFSDFEDQIDNYSNLSGHKYH